MSIEMINKAGLPNPRRVSIALATLFLATFVLGCAEMLVVGMLDLIAADLRVSIPAAGALLTAQALGMAVGGPILTALMIRLNRRTILVGALGLSVAANLVLVLTSEYGLFVAARAAAGAAQGLFIAAGIAVGVSLVRPERVGRAMSVVISGFAVSSAVGVPLGTLAGQVIGWRGSFVAVVVLAVTAGPGGQLAQSLPASAANLGIAFGSVTGGLAIGAYTASAAALTGLAIAVLAIAADAATSLLEPPTAKLPTPEQPRQLLHHDQ